MTFKKIVSTCLALCIMATLAVAMSGCEDLGAFDNTNEYYSSFGNIVLISGTTKEEKEYSVDKYFYNEDSREDFLKGEDRVAYSDYMYMAIPFNSNIDMDTLALYLQSQNDVTVYINAYVINKSEWDAIRDNDDDSEESTGDSENNEKVYDDPDTKIGEVAVHLKNGKWYSFALDVFNTSVGSQKSIQIKSGQYVLLQFKNNCVDENKQAYVDPDTSLELPKAEITMTNLLIRALDVKEGNETQGGN